MTLKLPSQSSHDSAYQKVLCCARAALDKQAYEVKVFHLTAPTHFMDYLMICSATSNRHAQSISDFTEMQLKLAGYSLSSKEGYSEGRWILLNFEDVIMHIFLDPIRKYYDLESLWKQAPEIPISTESLTH